MNLDFLKKVLQEDNEYDMLEQNIQDITINVDNIKKDFKINIPDFDNVPYWPNHEQDPRETEKRLFLKRSELDFKYQVYKNLSRICLNEVPKEPELLKLYKNGKDVFLFQIKGKYREEQLKKFYEEGLRFKDNKMFKKEKSQEQAISKNIEIQQERK